MKIVSLSFWEWKGLMYLRHLVLSLVPHRLDERGTENPELCIGLLWIPSIVAALLLNSWYWAIGAWLSEKSENENALVPRVHIIWWDVHKNSLLQKISCNKTKNNTIFISAFWNLLYTLQILRMLTMYSSPYHPVKTFVALFTGPVIRPSCSTLQLLLLS